MSVTFFLAAGLGFPRDVSALKFCAVPQYSGNISAMSTNSHLWIFSTSFTGTGGRPSPTYKPGSLADWLSPPTDSRLHIAAAIDGDVCESAEGSPDGPERPAVGNGPVAELCAGCDDVLGNGPVATGIVARTDGGGIIPNSVRGMGKADTITAARTLL